MVGFYVYDTVYVKHLKKMHSCAFSLSNSHKRRGLHAYGHFTKSQCSGKHSEILRLESRTPMDPLALVSWGTGIVNLYREFNRLESLEDTTLAMSEQ